MAVALRIARLHTQLQRPADRAEDGLEISWLQELSQRSLPAALAGVAERALARAGLPQEAVVAVRRLNLRLKLAAGASDAALLQAWSQALEQALVLALSRARQASAGPDWGTDPLESSALSNDTETSEQAVVFADAWAAEAAHLGGLLRTGRPAWWAERLLDGRGEPLDLAPAAILQRWLERQPARAVAAMALLAGETPGVENLLDPSTATAVAELMARRLSQRAEAPPVLPDIGSPLRALLEQSLGQLRRHPFLGADSHEAAATAAARRPWRLALLLHRQPALGLLPAQTLLAVADKPAAERFQQVASGMGQPANESSGCTETKPATASSNTNDPAAVDQASSDSEAKVAERFQQVASGTAQPANEARGSTETKSATAASNTNDPAAVDQASSDSAAKDADRSDTKRPSVLSDQDQAGLQPAAPHSAETNANANASASAWVHAGGLLLLLNRPELLKGAEPLPVDPADLALLALHRMVAPLPTAEREAALERERPLLALLAPDRKWPERISEAQIEDHGSAEARLAALIEAIPEEVAFAPGALRQVYGPRHAGGPPLPDGASHRLARLLWRPGLLEWDGWQISLAWPLASVDGALRRGGWDLDPGWQPALRRVVRFHYRAEVLPPLEGQP